MKIDGSFDAVKLYEEICDEKKDLIKQAYLHLLSQVLIVNQK
tara:strand:- start:63 stop:188 length:126 start_codon:yes stop_codon:yes gene_type:complete